MTTFEGRENTVIATRIRLSAIRYARKSSASVLRAGIERLETRTLLTSVIVNSVSDVSVGGGVVTLRDAITMANASATPTTITFDPVVFALPQTIVLGGAELDLTNTAQPTTITGPAAGVTVSGNSLSTVFAVEMNVTASLSQLIVTGGTGFDGGGIANNGNITLNNVAIVGNNSVGGDADGSGGAGLFNNGTAMVTDVTISGNSADNGGGGMFNDTTGIATLTNVTVSGNNGMFFGGGGIFDYGVLTLDDVTVTNNTTGGYGAGIANMSGFGPATINMVNTIVAGNTISNNSSQSSADVGATVNSLGYNLVGISDGSTGLTSMDLTGTAASPLNADLGPLANNGGFTQTVLPMADSPAIGHGNVADIPAGITTDQRGFPRLFNGMVDIGAVEAQASLGPASITFTPPAAQTATVGQTAPFTLGAFAATNATGPFNVDVNWGDGSADSTFTVSAAGTIPPAAHAYGAVGNNTATVTVTDAAGDPTTPGMFSVNAVPAAKIGGVDPTFGVDGLAAHDVGLSSTAGVVVQGDGKSVIVGTAGSAGAEMFGITRYNADGSLDTTFGTNGVTISTLPGSAQATAEFLLPSGDILVAGTDTTLVNGQSAGSQFALAEYTSAGVLDPSFGNGAGYVLTSFSTTAGTLSNDTARAMTVGPDGTIYVGGSSDASGHGLDFAIAAYSSAGAPSASFGTNGEVLLDFSGGDDSIAALAFGDKGSLIAAGSAATSAGGPNVVALAAFLPSGALNPKFGAKGKLTTAVGGVDDAASALAIDAKGNILVGGYTATGSASAGTLSSNFLLIRYTSAGKVDRTFGGGVITTSFNQPAAISSLLIGADGTVVASGKTSATLTNLDASALELAVARYTDKGQLDTSFNGTGQAIISLAGAVVTQSLTTPLVEQPAVSQSFSVQPFDAAGDLMAAFMQLTQSDQGVIAMASGGDLFDVGNSGANTVEAAIISMGLDLATTLVASLPSSIIGGGKGTASVNIAEAGAELAAGTFTVELFASGSPYLTSGQTPFESFPEKLKLKEGMAKSLHLKFDYPSSLTKGDYYLLASVDTGAARDLNLSNNTSASGATVLIAPPFVQLAGSGLTAPTFNGAKPAQVSFTIMNVGNEAASATSAVQFFASIDGTLTGAISLGTSPLAIKLKAGASHPYKAKLTLAAGVLVPGAYKLLALLDPNNVFNDPNAATNFIVSGNTFSVT